MENKFNYQFNSEKSSSQFLAGYLDPETEIRRHYRLLGHTGYGVTEMRVFDGRPKVTYVDNEDDFVHRCLEVDGKVSGVYVGVNPRPVDFMELAHNSWKPARGQSHPNCARDRDIEFITLCFMDFDVVSDERMAGHPASEPELKRTLELARRIACSNGLALSAIIAYSGNGHYLLIPIVPIAVEDDETALKYQTFFVQLVQEFSGIISGVKIDNVSNPSRVMRVMGTQNRKGRAIRQRPYRRAHFVTEPLLMPSMALHYMILNTEVKGYPKTDTYLKEIKGDLSKLEQCEFIRWCRAKPEMVSEPQWFGLISNLAPLQGGAELIHEISQLDRDRYDYQHTQALIERIQKNGYKPIGCQKLINTEQKGNGYGCFACSRINRCSTRAPIYLTAVYTIYRK